MKGLHGDRRIPSMPEMLVATLESGKITLVLHQ